MDHHVISDLGFGNCTPPYTQYGGNVSQPVAQSGENMTPRSPQYGAGVHRQPMYNLTAPVPRAGSLAEMTESEARWIIPQALPQGEIVLIAGDGGVGKTAVWINILAGLSGGKRCILDDPYGEANRQAMRTLFFSSEESVPFKLRKKIREAGADLNMVLTVDLSSPANKEVRSEMYIGSMVLEEYIRQYRPAVCVLDPIQSFIPAAVNMGSRNAMRSCMDSLVRLGAEYGTTFILICHTNKRKDAFGRNRISDSADLWDIARCVYIVGNTGDEDTRFISQEKNNNGPLQPTVLFTINDDGQVVYQGTSDKHDADYTSARPNSGSKRDACKRYMLEYLYYRGGACSSSDLDSALSQRGYAKATVNRARAELSRENKIASTQQCHSDGSREWFWYVVDEAHPSAQQAASQPWMSPQTNPPQAYDPWAVTSPEEQANDLCDDLPF